MTYVYLPVCLRSCLQLLLNRGADVNAVDADGGTALRHAMHFDKRESLTCAQLLVEAGARDKACVDMVGESWPHRAVRYGGWATGNVNLVHACQRPLGCLAVMCLLSTCRTSHGAVQRMEHTWMPGRQMFVLALHWDVLNSGTLLCCTVL